MLRVDHLGRHFEAGEYDKLLREVAHNGLELPLPLRVRLSQGPVAPIALGLRRLVELTYGPTPLSREMTAALLAEQRPDGSFAADGDRGDPLATAAALAALNRLGRDHVASATPEVGQARERALAALAAMQDDDGLFRRPDDRTEAQRALTAAFILNLLGEDDDFRAAVRWADLLSWFDERFDRLDPAVANLVQLARARDTARLIPVPAIAA